LLWLPAARRKKLLLRHRLLLRLLPHRLTLLLLRLLPHRLLTLLLLRLLLLRLTLLLLRPLLLRLLPHRLTLLLRLLLLRLHPSNLRLLHKKADHPVGFFYCLIAARSPLFLQRDPVKSLFLARDHHLDPASGRDAEQRLPRKLRRVVLLAQMRPHHHP